MCENMQYGVASVVNNCTVWIRITREIIDWINKTLVADCHQLPHWETMHEFGFDPMKFIDFNWAKRRCVIQINAKIIQRKACILN